MTRGVDNTQDYLDVRDIIARFEELERERADLADALAEATEDCTEEAKPRTEPDGTEVTQFHCDLANSVAKRVMEEAREALTAWDEDNGEELKGLADILGELEGNGGDEQWRGHWYPITLIRDSYFVEAMQELVQDIGDLPKNIPCYLEIDWDKTADNLRADYSSVEFGDVTYWYR